MSGKIELLGVDELLADIRARLGNGAKRIENKGLRQAAQAIADTQKGIVAVSDRSGTHIKDDIRVSGVRRDKLYGTRYVLVGGTKLTKWRHHFLEFGSSKQNPQPFIQPAFDQSKDEAISTLIDHLRKGLEQK